MGSLPELSILKGEKRNVRFKKLHKEIEELLEINKDNVRDNDSIIFDDNGVIRRTTYQQMNEQANRLARGILHRAQEHSLTVNADGDYIVAVCMQPTDELVIALLAIMKSGAAYVPIDPTFPEQRVKHILGEAKPIIIIHDDSVATEMFSGTEEVSYKKLVEETRGMSSENISDNLRFKQTTPNLVIVLYTSGSTGTPKGVRLPHNIIQNRLQWQYEAFPYSDTEKICVFKTALTFVDSVCELWGPLLNGLTVLVVPKSITRNPEKLIKMLADYEIERLSLVPSLLRSMLLYLSLEPQGHELLKFLKIWVSSGESLSASLAKDFFEYFGPGKQLCNFYGSTEIMADVTYFVVKCVEDLKDYNTVPLGTPIFNTILYLLDDNMQPVPLGEMGELWASGLNVAAGYVCGRSPDKFVNNPLAQSQEYSRLYRTGDFVKLIKGLLVFEGRTDSQIKIRGHRVDLSEVEKSVLAVEGIEKGVVLCYKPGEMDQALLAFVTCTDTKLSGYKIESLLKDKLAAYMIPQIIILDKIPLLVNGKNDRQALLKLYENTNNNDDAAPVIDIDFSGVPSSKMPAADVIFNTIGSVIGRSARGALSMTSNYFELGGNSLNAIYTITKLKEQGYEIGITDFIMAENLGEILDKITGSDFIENRKEIHEYYMEPPQLQHREEVDLMVVTSFYEKADLEKWLKPEVKKEDYSTLIRHCWKYAVDQNVSFIARRKSDGMGVGVTLCFDARDEPEIILESELNIVFEFLEYLEGPIREHLPSGKGKILHSFMMATHPSLSAQENIFVIKAMEEELVRMAGRKGFAGIFTTNTSPLTQQLGDVMGYQVMMDYQINQFVSASGRAPFREAPDDQRAIVGWKEL